MIESDREREGNKTQSDGVTGSQELTGLHVRK